MIFLAEPTSSNDEEDEDESENETQLIPREVLLVRKILQMIFEN